MNYWAIEAQQSMMFSFFFTKVNSTFYGTIWCHWFSIRLGHIQCTQIISINISKWIEMSPFLWMLSTLIPIYIVRQYPHKTRCMNPSLHALYFKCVQVYHVYIEQILHSYVGISCTHILINLTHLPLKKQMPADDLHCMFICSGLFSSITHLLKPMFVVELDNWRVKIILNMNSRKLEKYFKYRHWCVGNPI